MKCVVTFSRVVASLETTVGLATLAMAAAVEGRGKELEEGLNNGVKDLILKEEGGMCASTFFRGGVSLERAVGFFTLAGREEAEDMEEDRVRSGRLV